MLTPDAPQPQPAVPFRQATRFARGRLILWVGVSVMVALLDRDLLRELPRWVFAVWALWIAVSAMLVIALEYLLEPKRRPWLEATQACIDLPVIAALTWHAGAGPYLLAPGLAIPMASAIGWLPKRAAITVTAAAGTVMVLVIVLIASGAPVPPPVGSAGGSAAPRDFLLMTATVQLVSLLTIAWLLGSAVRVARERRDRWQRLFDSAPDSIFVLDRRGAVVRMNAAARRITGTSDVRSRDGAPVEFTAPEHRALAAVHVQRALGGESSSYEARGMRADGVPSHVRVSNAPLAEDGEITGVLSIVHDVTDIRMAEQERRVIERTLDQHRRLLQSIVSTVPTYLYVLDFRLRHVTFANDALLQMLGCTLEEVSAMPRAEILAHYHPDDVEMLRRSARTLRHHEDAKLDLSYRVRSATGEWRWLEDRITVFERDPDGSVTRVLGSAIDVTEQKRVSAQLQFSDELYRT
ncbi:MAG TPA: PAS domain S-box protein, partial [Gemmatimonadaceae bacterium]|nr:PAS domain S-box protein [Gemmatimonadaceae bacterium]